MPGRKYEAEYKKRDAQYTRASVVMVMAFIVCNTPRFIPNVMEIFVELDQWPQVSTECFVKFLYIHYLLSHFKNFVCKAKCFWTSTWFFKSLVYSSFEKHHKRCILHEQSEITYSIYYYTMRKRSKSTFLSDKFKISKSFPLNVDACGSWERVYNTHLCTPWL